MKSSFSLIWELDDGPVKSSTIQSKSLLVKDERLVPIEWVPGEFGLNNVEPFIGYNTIGTYENATSVKAADEVSTGLFYGALAVYYFQIWVIPRTLTAQNPSVGIGIPFNIWNAYPYPNTLQSISAEDDEGLELNFEPPDEWRAIEYREVEISITPAAPIQISASYEFVFEFGAGQFFFEAVIADFVQMRPDPPVTEHWDWLTDVVVGHNGVEQRIALRDTPRRSTSYEIGLEHEADRRQQYNRWFTSLATRLVFPYYQYSVRIDQPADIGDTEIFFDPAKTDMRGGEFVVILSEATETGGLVRLDEVTSTGAILDSPLQFSVNRGSIVSPAFSSRIENRSGFQMFQVHGLLKVEAQVLDVRSEFSRPGSSAVIQRLDGLPILTELPIATSGPSPEDFDVNYEVIDSDTGLLDIKSSWPHPKVIMQRKFAVRRFQEAEKMDWWRDFLDEVKGMRGPFLMSTQFGDLVPAENPATDSAILRIFSQNYESSYFPFETYRRIEILLKDGRRLWREVLSVTENEPGDLNLNLSSSFGSNAADVDIERVSFLNLCRLSSDRVTLIHDHQRTEIQLSIQTTDDFDEL